MFISYANATVDAGAGQSSILFTLLPFVPIIAIMYFLIVRPQRIQMKKRQEQLAAIRRGDTVVTGGGVVGKVTKVIDESNELEVEIAEGVRVRVTRYSVADVRVKGDVITDVETTNKEVKKPASKKTRKKTEE
ncbi:preprotein translocase subunit YajC [Bartonella sp. DGB1]|uniref:preprotein translocase subunit YajC n=1 Tax=Bartonella sp. DGB1 TaxID=3239807 RepID=UPI003525DA5B